jgi:AAA domain
VLAVSGGSGAGKSTVARTLERDHGWVRLAEAYDRLRPRPDLEPSGQATLRSVELRLLAEEGRRFREALGHAGRGRSVVVDTSFLDPVAYTAGLLVTGEASPATFRAVVARARGQIARGELGLPDLTCYLRTSERTRRRRASGDPVRHPERLRDRHERVGRLDASLVRAALARGAPGRVRGVRASGRPARLARVLAAAASGVAPLADPSSAAARALVALLGDPAIRTALAGWGNLKKATLSPRPPR